jgi:ArsR family transcriptional regulator
MEINGLINCIKVLADPTRMKLLDLIKHGTQCNCEFSDALELPPNLISHHLRILRKCGLVETEKDPLDARWVYYNINKKTFIELREFFTSFLIRLRYSPELSRAAHQVLF